eukprot:6187843-Pleurochrysis_carterae.AAC.2
MAVVSFRGSRFVLLDLEAKGEDARVLEVWRGHGERDGREHLADEALRAKRRRGRRRFAGKPRDGFRLCNGLSRENNEIDFRGKTRKWTFAVTPETWFRGKLMR